jgi:hypothetical protein
MFAIKPVYLLFRTFTDKIGFQDLSWIDNIFLFGER